MMTSFVKIHRSKLLLCAFIGQLLLSPLADAHLYIGVVLALFLLLLVLLGVSYTGNRRAVRFLVLPLAAIWLIARMLEAFGNGHHLYSHLAPAAGSALSLAVLWAILNRLSSLPRVASDVIAEAFIGYIVIAIAFSQIYWVLSRIVTNPFNQSIPAAHISTLLYFSLVTLSTVGYGGIAPVDSYVRLIAALESMTGIFYIAVVVARLVSSYGPMVAVQRYSIAPQAAESAVQARRDWTHAQTDSLQPVPAE